MIIHMDKLTNEQQKFASDHHYLVDTFLKARHLKKDEYYGIAALGFIRAVKKYFLRTDLRKYNFSTIALYAMKSDLINYYRKQGRQKRTAYIVSLDNAAYSDGDMTIAETVAAPDSVTDYLDAEILWNDITSNLSDDCVKILRMKTEGYNNREIAKTQGISVKDIELVIKQIQEKVSDICHVKTVNQ